MAPRDEMQKLIDSLNDFTPQGAHKPIAMKGSDVEYVKVIPCFSPALAYILSVGGWPEGKLIEIFGKEHSGKTSLALLFLKDCYDYYRGEKLIAYIDLEHRFNKDWAEKLGLNVNDDLLVVQPPDTETGTDIMTRLVKSNKFCAIVWDSIGGAATKHSMQELTEKNDKMGGNAGPMKRNVQTIAPLANLYNVTVCYLNQLRDDMEGYNRPMTPGGHAVKHAMSIRIYLRPGRDKYMDKVNGEMVQVGQPIMMKTVKNSYGPYLLEGWTDFYNQPCSYLDHVGVDVDTDLARMGILLGVAHKAGSWFSWEDIREQGRETFFKKLWESGRMDEFQKEIIETIKSGKQVVEILGDDLLTKPESNAVDLEDA